MAIPFIVVTGGDAKYFELLQACVRSFRDIPQGREVPIGVFDLGLTPDQVTWLKHAQAQVVVPDWDIALRRSTPLPDYYKALTVRPFLPKYFPEAEMLFWLDADAWLQDWSAIELFRRAAADGALACVPEIDRSFRNFYHAWDEFHAVIGEAYRDAFGQATADEMTRYPLINSGAFALRPDSPTWGAWAGLMAEGLSNTDKMLAEQCALNIAVYKQGAKKHFLPTWCNWTAHHSTPAWDAERRCFVEPYLPYQKIGILHLTVWTKEQQSVQVRQVGGPHDGTSRAMSLRYPARGTMAAD